MLTIYKASAGSGKTYTLAYEYILALLGVKNPLTGEYRLNLPKYRKTGEDVVNRHRGILAITFTNKATEEMKRRIVDELDALSHEPAAGVKDANYAEALCRQLGCTRGELAECAAIAMHQLLYDYQNFNISTIDSFFQRVLRVFARELDRQGDFSIELSDRFAVQTAVGVMLDEFNYSPKERVAQLDRWLTNYMFEQVEEGRKSNIFNRGSIVHGELLDLVERICNEEFKPYSAQMRQYLSDPERIMRFSRELSAYCRGLPDANAKEAAETLAELEARGVGIECFMSGASTLVQNALDKNLPKKPEELNGANIVKTIDPENMGCYTKKYFKGGESDVRKMKELVVNLRKRVILYYTYSEVHRSLSKLGVLAYAWRYLDQFSAENNVVLISDTTDLLRRIIDGSELPFIYERLGMQLHHFLIDEFQDTSEMQWKNLKPLVANGLASNYDSLIIGDEKQSIYRFRNSESSLLHHRVAQDDFPDNHRVRGAAPGENTNYRSSRQVVEFNNIFFKTAAAAAEIDGFENVVQEVPKHHSDFEGYVRFIPVQEMTADARSFVLMTLAEQIRRQHESGYRWRDIAVLVRSNAQATEVINYMLETQPDIPVCSDESLFLNNSTAVQLIVSILKLMEAFDVDPGGTRDEHVRSTPDQVALVLSRYEYYRSTGLDNEAALARAAEAVSNENFNLEQGENGRTPATLPALVEGIIHRHLSEQMRAAQAAYITAFQDVVIDFCSHYIPSAHEFLQWWEVKKSKLTISGSSDVDAVRVLTIHKSKGLEYGCVHIPYGSELTKDKTSGHWYALPEIPGISPELVPPAVYLKPDKKMAFEESPMGRVYAEERRKTVTDEMNISYVAYTRAVSELIVYGQVEEKKTFAAEVTGALDVARRSLSGVSEDKFFEYGKPTMALAESEKAKPVAMEVGYPTYSRDDTRVLTTVADIRELDSDIDDDPGEEIIADNRDEARQRGIVLHDVMAHIRHVEDIDKAVDKVCSDKRLSEAETEDVRATMHDIFGREENAERVERWFGEYRNVLIEQPIYLPERGETRRPDRIVIYEDGTVDIVDYKFTTERLPEHQAQVAEYAALLREMGYEQVRTNLWYLV